MELNEAREKFIFTTKIELEDDDYIVLKEPTSLMLREFGEDGKQNVTVLQQIFPKCLVEHSFTENGVPAKNEKVAAFLLDSGSKFSEIVEIWLDSLPLKKKKAGN